MKYILQRPFFEGANTAGIWLPPAEGFDTTNPHLSGIKTIDITLLSSSLDTFLFRRLPLILANQRDQVQWHLNPSCKSCKFAYDCEVKTVETGQLGSIPNLSVEDVHVLKDLLYLAKSRLGSTTKALTDIEELHTLVNTEGLLNRLAVSGSSTVKRSRQLLAIPRRKKHVPGNASPVVEAAMSRKIQVRIRAGRLGGITHLCQFSGYPAFELHLPFQRGHSDRLILHRGSFHG